MSGHIVGEVLAAAPRLREMGLSERGFHALVAVAEKAHTSTRQASVPWSHIQAGLYGASYSTAKRAVRDLKTAELVRVVRRGFNNHHGRACAPIYEVAPLGERLTQVTHSGQGERLTQVTHKRGGERVKTGGRMGQNGGPTGHPGDLLNGSTNGSANGEGPPRFCSQHPNGTERNCGPCGTARLEYEKWETEKAERDRRDREARRQARKDCNICAGDLYVLGADGTPVDPATPCPACKPPQVVTA